jgi:Chlorophyll A-B binding protein
MREAEVKHSRLAMLAVIGWPLAELYDSSIAQTLNLPSKLTSKGMSPSILNGGLDQIDILYWAAVILLAGIVEIESDKTKSLRGNDYIPGDCNFDPLSFYPKRKEEQKDMQTKELKHGRIAMMALVGYIVVEILYQKPIIAVTPQFFQNMLF